MITRRHALAGLASVGVVAPLGRALADTERLFFYELYRPGTIELSDAALALNGRSIEMVGFMAPPLKADAPFFVLTDVPMETCPFCDEIAFWPDNIVFVTSDDVLPSIPFNRQIRVSGVFEVGEAVDPTTGFVSLVRLSHARIVRA